MQKKAQKGFTLIELMIVVAILGILGSFSIPQYVKYSKRAKFTEVVTATVKYKQTAEVAFQLGTTLADLDSGSNGIPAAITPATSTSIHIKSLDIQEGKITATGTAPLQDAVYQLEASPSDGGLTWSLNTTVSTCIDLGYCSPLL